MEIIGIFNHANIVSSKMDNAVLRTSMHYPFVVFQTTNKVISLKGINNIVKTNMQFLFMFFSNNFELGPTSLPKGFLSCLCLKINRKDFIYIPKWLNGPHKCALTGVRCQK